MTMEKLRNDVLRKITLGVTPHLSIYDEFKEYTSFSFDNVTVLSNEIIFKITAFYTYTVFGNEKDMPEKYKEIIKVSVKFVVVYNKLSETFQFYELKEVPCYA